MESEKCELESIFKGEVVGINTGFLAQGNEKYYDLMVENTIELIKWILSNTKFNIALIPHVNWSYEYSDYYTLKKIYDIFEENSNRIEIISEKSANQQKYVMSQCKFMIALRTHVAIPSIASQVPTLVTGYKQKSAGIVRDIFPDNFKVLADVTSIKTDKDYIEHFQWMLENESMICKYMKENIPAYIERVKKIKDLIGDLANNKHNDKVS
jgi:polysaccharide pyruvyl transferase WcaK-like protein